MKEKTLCFRVFVFNNETMVGVSGNSFLGGGSASNMGSMFVILKPWKERKGKENSVDAVISARPHGGAVPWR